MSFIRALSFFPSLQLALILLTTLLPSCSSSLAEDSQSSSPFQTSVLIAIQEMPTGGGYSGTDTTKNLLCQACKAGSNGTLIFEPAAAKPSFCSGATYLVFLKALAAQTSLSPTEAAQWVVQPNQSDGSGLFGRWNANGPGCAKLISDLDAGDNFSSWEKAQAGDFLKIWWTESIGGNERGHHVVYLSHTTNELTFWSSNLETGYSTKTIPRARCKRVLFTRITKPTQLRKASRLPATDPWLERMLHDDFTWREVAKTCEVNED